MNKIDTLPPYMTKTKTTEDIGILIGVNCMSKFFKKARFISKKAQIVISLVNGIEVKAGLCERDANVLLANKQQGLSELLRDWLANQTERFPEDRKNEDMKMAEMLPVQKHQETLTYVPDRDPPYQVGLLWKKDPDHTLGNNYANAARSMRMILRKFKREPELRSLYQVAMKGFMEQDDVERVWEFGNHPNTYYLPHPAVVDLERITTKLRVVMNGSSKAGENLSLNDFLLKGPSLQPDLKNLLLKTRKHKILLTVDVSRMYIRSSVRPEDRDFLRFLLMDGEKMGCWRFKKLIFGAADPPFLAIATVREHTKRFHDRFPDAAETILSYMYVDDLITSLDSEEEAIQLFHDLRALMELAGMRLRKWASNNEKVLQDIPKEDRLCKDEFIFAKDKEAGCKALGFSIDCREDIFTFQGLTGLTDVRGSFLKTNVRIRMQWQQSVMVPVNLLVDSD